MSRRYRGAILSPSSISSSRPVSGLWTIDQQYNAKGAGLWPLPPSTPTIGTATAGFNLCASVTFSAGSCAGYPPPLSYVVTSTPGCITASGASSPIVVTGLTSGTAYTFKVKATNSSGLFSACSAASNSVTPVVTGQTAYTTAGTYSYVVPTGVTSVSMVTVGGGGGGGWPYAAGGGGGGALAYVNNVAVTAGATISVTVGAGGSGATTQFGAGYPGGFSQVVYSGTTRARANGGAGGYLCSVAGGTVATGTGGSGGTGGGGREPGGGGGGAGGYSGNGGNGGVTFGCLNGTAGSGGGGNGGNAGYYSYQCWGSGCGSYYIKEWYGGANGGGVSILGLGGASPNYGYGAGGGGAYEFYYAPYTQYPGGPGGGGAVRIIYPGNTRSFPSTNTGNLP